MAKAFKTTYVLEITLINSTTVTRNYDSNEARDLDRKRLEGTDGSSDFVDLTVGVPRIIVNRRYIATIDFIDVEAEADPD